MDELEAAVAVKFDGGCGGEGFIGFTTSVVFTEWDRPPLVPAIVRVKVPVAADTVVAMFTVAEPAPLIEAGVKLAEAPDGRPVAVSVTAPVNPFCAPMVTV